MPPRRSVGSQNAWEDDIPTNDELAQTVRRLAQLTQAIGDRMLQNPQENRNGNDMDKLRHRIKVGLVWPTATSERRKDCRMPRRCRALIAGCGVAMRTAALAPAVAATSSSIPCSLLLVYEDGASCSFGC
nr:putative mediator of RNA polymerase II transcription subunit 24 [Ipomoea batatas]